MMVLGGLVIFIFPSMVGFVIGQILFGIGPAAFFAAAFAFVADVAAIDQRGSAIARFGLLINAAEAIAPPIGLWLGFTGRPWGFGWASFLSLLAIPLFVSIRNPSISVGQISTAEEKQQMVPRTWWLPLGLTALIATSYGVINAYLPQNAIHAGSNSGWFFVANFGIQILFRLVANKTLDRRNRQTLVAVGAFLMAVSTILLSYFASNGELLIFGAVYGIGNFYVTPSLVAWLISLSETRKGSSMSAYNAAFGAGVAFGAMILGPLFSFLDLPSITFWAAGLLGATGMTAVFSKVKRGALQ